MNIWKLLALLIMGGLFLFSCNNKSGSGDKTSTQNENKASAETIDNMQTEANKKTQAKHQAVINDTVRLEITGNDQMRFNKKELKIKAGTVVVLTLKHVGELPKTAMGHNWVLLKANVDMGNFAQEAMKAKDNDYIPSGLTGEIIAYTKMLGGGESDTIIFNAPPIGTYNFLCSFPGHYAIMNGKFIVEKSASAL